MVLAIPEKRQYTPINKILFTTKYHLSDIEALQKVQHLATVFHAQVDCLNVKPPHKVQEEDFVIDFKNVFKNQNITFHSILSNDVEGEILKVIEKSDINILAIHIKHKGFFEKLFQISLSKKLANDINTPILSIQ